LEVTDIKKFESEMHVYFKQEHPEIVAELNEKKVISDELNGRMMIAMKTFVDLFKKMKGI
jgi:F-type H+-transporting ATPase subunit alpha